MKAQIPGPFSAPWLKLCVRDSRSGCPAPVSQDVIRAKSLGKQLQKAFEAQGLIKFGAVGESFDPHKHDAMFEAEDPEKEPGTIAHLVKAGYELNGRVIRPAQVGTVKAPAAS